MNDLATGTRHIERHGSSSTTQGFACRGFRPCRGLVHVRERDNTIGAGPPSSVTTPGRDLLLGRAQREPLGLYRLRPNRQSSAMRGVFRAPPHHRHGVGMRSFPEGEQRALERSPARASNLAMWPACGDGISTTAFSVSTETTG